MVFGQWEGLLEAMGHTLERAGHAYLTLVGGGIEQRLSALRRFGRPGEPRCMLLAAEAHASGINLQVARYVVLLHPHCPEAVLTAGDLYQRSLSETVAFERQAIGRVRRYPQTREVRVYRLYLQGTVEEELLAAQGVV